MSGAIVHFGGHSIVIAEDRGPSYADPYQRFIIYNPGAVDNGEAGVPWEVIKNRYPIENVQYIYWLNG